MTPQEYVQQKAAASGSSFYYAFLFLPPVRRAAITAFYAFCREVDDVVDEVSDPGVAQTKLAWWRALQAVPYWRLAAWAMAAGAVALVAGLLVFGRDGKMATYGLLVAAIAATLWWRGPRRLA